MVRRWCIKHLWRFGLINMQDLIEKIQERLDEAMAMSDFFTEKNDNESEFYAGKEAAYYDCLELLKIWEKNNDKQ